MTTIKLITLDLDNTLWPTDDVIQRAETLASDWLIQRLPQHAAALSAQQVRAARLDMLAQQPTYRHSMSALRRDSLRLLLSSLKVPHQDIPALVDTAFDIFLAARNQVTFFPDVLKTLEILAARWPLIAITNGNADLETIGIRHHFIAHHSAESVGRGKPDARIFQAALDSAQRSAQQTLHVGDHPVEDIEGARALGFHTAWANFFGARWPQHLPPADAEIHTFSELPALPLLQQTTG